MIWLILESGHAEADVGVDWSVSGPWLGSR